MDEYEISDGTWLAMRALIDDLVNTGYEITSRKVLINEPTSMLDDKYLTVIIGCSHFLKGRKKLRIDGLGSIKRVKGDNDD